MIATDVSKLIDLARNRTAEGRSALVSAIGDLIEDDRQFSAQEMALMNDILKKLINDVARPIRKALAEKLATPRARPPEVIEILANDEIDVSVAILQHSELLTDRALIDIIRKRTREHRLAIAMRKHVSNGVSDGAGGAPANPDVIKRLLENHGAEISQATLAYLVDQSTTVDEFQEPLLRRHDLSADLAKRMYVHVSAGLRNSSWRITTSTAPSSMRRWRR